MLRVYASFLPTEHVEITRKEKKIVLVTKKLILKPFQKLMLHLSYGF